MQVHEQNMNKLIRKVYIYIYDLVPKGAHMGDWVFDCQ